jgi:CBS domain-containing protein
MATRTVRRLPVVDEMDRPLGMISLDDLVRHIGVEADALVDTIILQTAKPAAI